MIDHKRFASTNSEFYVSVSRKQALPKYKKGRICDAVAVSIAGSIIGVVGLYKGLCSMAFKELLHRSSWSAWKSSKPPENCKKMLLSLNVQHFKRQFVLRVVCG